MNKFNQLYPNKHNFCRVFELPETFPNQYCFGGGHIVPFKMVDWFNPWPTDLEIKIYNKVGLKAPNNWQECCYILLPFLLEKNYVKKGREYIVITTFGESFTFHGDKKYEN